MRGSTPTLHCDESDGLCGTWDIDYYADGAYSVGGTRITETERAPGWRCVDGADLCPEHTKVGERRE